MDIQIRAVEREELPVAARVFEVAALEGGGPEETATAISYIEPATTLGAFLGDRLVGTTADYDVDLTVPGGAFLPASAVTMVATLPTHTRRGIGRRLMEAQLDRQRVDGRAVAVLEASEGRIYGRFGFGSATRHTTAGLRTTAAAFHTDLDDDGSFEYAEDEAIVHFAAPLWDAVRATRPGRLSRPANWWAMTLFDPPGWREGAGPLMAVFHVSAAGEPDGYALYRITPRSEGHVSMAELKVLEVVSPDPHVSALLWQFLIQRDLVGTMMIDGLALDDPLWWLLDDVRQIRAISSRDGLWVRILDVPTALQARTYSADGDLTLDVIDRTVAANHGRFRLAIRDGIAECVGVDDDGGPADVTIPVDMLGSLLLGGVDARTLAGAGRLGSSSPTSLRTLAAMCRGDVEPHHVGMF